MSGNSSIEWTGSTWNPLVGCTKVSQGCKHCYAMTMAARIANAAQAKERAGGKPTDIQEAYRKVVRFENDRETGTRRPHGLERKFIPDWNNEIALIESVLLDPLRWKRGRPIFVNSMSDLFHEKVPFDFVDKVFAVMALCPQHTFQVLTKRPDRMAEYLATVDERFESLDHLCPFGPHWHNWETELRRPLLAPAEWDAWVCNDFPKWPLRNVWLGASCENQKEANERHPHIASIYDQGWTTFWSAEPLLGPILIGEALSRSGRTLTPVRKLPAKSGHGTGPLPETGEDSAVPGLSWVIVGGESGHGARPMHPDWVRSLRDQCQAWGIPFFFKQWGQWAPVSTTDGVQELPFGNYSAKTGFGFKHGSKHDNGRVLDGRLWDEYPEARV